MRWLFDGDKDPDPRMIGRRKFLFGLAVGAAGLYLPKTDLWTPPEPTIRIMSYVLEGDGWKHQKTTGKWQEFVLSTEWRLAT